MGLNNRVPLIYDVVYDNLSCTLGSNCSISAHMAASNVSYAEHLLIQLCLLHFVPIGRHICRVWAVGSSEDSHVRMVSMDYNGVKANQVKLRLAQSEMPSLLRAYSTRHTITCTESRCCSKSNVIGSPHSNWLNLTFVCFLRYQWSDPNMSWDLCTR